MHFSAFEIWVFAGFSVGLSVSSSAGLCSAFEESGGGFFCTLFSKPFPWIFPWVYWDLVVFSVGFSLRFSHGFVFGQCGFW